MSDSSGSTAYVGFRQVVVEYADTGMTPAEIYEKVEANHPELADDYVLSQRAGLLRQAIRQIIIGRRQTRMSRARVAVAEAKIEAGESLLLANFPSADGGRKLLAEMTKVDLLHFASSQQQRAGFLLSSAQLARAIARKVPKGRTVGDVFSPEQVATLVSRFVDGEAA